MVELFILLRKLNTERIKYIKENLYIGNMEYYDIDSMRIIHENHSHKQST